MSAAADFLYFTTIHHHCSAGKTRYTTQNRCLSTLFLHFSERKRHVYVSFCHYFVKISKEENFFRRTKSTYFYTSCKRHFCARNSYTPGLLWLVDPKSSFDAYESAITYQLPDFEDFVEKVMEMINFCCNAMEIVNCGTHRHDFKVRRWLCFTLIGGCNNLLHSSVFIFWRYLYFHFYYVFLSYLIFLFQNQLHHQLKHEMSFLTSS